MNDIKDTPTPAQLRGAASIGQIDDLPPLEQLAVLCLRGLGRGPDLRFFLTRRFGAAQGAKVLARCDELAQFLARFARRPLMRHAPDCTCLGADEAVFAHLCALAADGDRDELLMFAMTMCRADLAPCLMPLAEIFVLSLQQAIAATRPAGCPVSASRLH